MHQPSASPAPQASGARPRIEPFLVEPLEFRRCFSTPVPGTLDPTFGQNGSLSFTAQTSLDIQTVAACALPGGKVLMLGKTYFVGSQRVFSAALERLNADGSPDPTFGTGGVRLMYDDGGVGQPFVDPRGMAVDRKGRIYVVGHYGWTRLKPNGSVDRHFARAFAASGSSTSYLNTVAIEPDGDVLLGGYYPDGASPRGDDGKHNFSITRLRPNGALDLKFGDQGRAIVEFSAAGARVNSAVHAFTVDARGRILAAGGEDGQYDLVRLRPDGLPDRSFADRGEAVVAGSGLPESEGAFSGHALSFFHAISQRASDGEIFVAGGSNSDYFFGSGGPLVVAAYGASGQPDLRFGDRGVVRLPLSDAPGPFLTVQPRSAMADGIVLLKHGEFLISGHYFSSSGPVGELLTRLTSTGTPDPAFARQLDAAPGSVSSEGLHLLPIVPGSYPQIGIGLLPTRHGRIFLPVSAASVFGPYARFACLRLNPDGSLDLTYGKKGIGTTSISYPDQQTPAGLVTGPGGTIYLTLEGNNASRTVTLDPNGTPAAALAFDAAVDHFLGSFGGRNVSPIEYAVIGVQPDGKRLVEDRRVNDGLGIARFNQDGTIDTTFGDGGYAHFGGGSGAYTLGKLLVRPDGSLILNVIFNAGYIYGPVIDTLYALDAQGHVTASRAIPSVSFFGFSSTYADMALAADGGLLLATHTWNPVTFQLISSVLTRLDPAQLTPDASYGINGTVDVPEVPEAIATLPDGRTLVASVSRSPDGNSDSANIIALTISGEVDPGFSPIEVALSSGAPGIRPGGLLPLRDGSFLVVSQASADSPSIVTRYLSNGAVDLAFADGGVLPLPTGSTTTALQKTLSTESLLVAGAVKPAETSRYDSNKTESTAFLERFVL